MEAPPSCFTHGWPPGITYAALKPHYDTVARVMNLQTLPDGQLTARLKLRREAAEKLGHLDRFSKAPLAVSFSPDWHYGLDEPFDRRHSRFFVNAQGQQHGTCIHLGHCDIGCEVRAKNGLDLTYLPLAEQNGCVVRPLHVVRLLEPHDAGYRVEFERIVRDTLVRGDVRADRVFLAAGSLGSTELLLRARDEHGTLPNLSPMLGRGWSPNANVLSMAAYKDGDRVQQSVGPTTRPRSTSWTAAPPGTGSSSRTTGIRTCC
jgi:cholesterol oxidase